MAHKAEPPVSLDHPVYLDHAASTPMRAEAVAAMLPFLTDRFANSTGAHAAARVAKDALEEARETVARELGAAPGEVVFTGSGTEADNLGVVGAARAARDAGGGAGVVTCRFEHKAVLASADRLEREGFAVRRVPATRDGVVDLDALADALADDTAVVSIMLVNNEIGTIQPLDAVAALVRERAPAAVLHTDAVQAVPWLDVAVAAAGASLVSISAHKFGGPKGMGALVVRDGVTVQPIVEGGGQERGRRAGTADVPGAVAMATALALTARDRTVEVARVGALRDRLRDGLFAAVDDVVDTARGAAKVAGSCHRRVPWRRRRAARRGARPGRRLRVRRVVVLVGGDAVVARPRRDGTAARRAARRREVQPGCRVRRHRCRARARRDPRRRRVAPRTCRGRRAMTARREVLVAMSGGVDSSVAAALLLDAGHDVTGVTLRLWGGETESGCCSVSDVEDARRVAAQLGIPHYVFNLSEEFERAVVDGYVDAYASGRTPNPCVECNRSIKFGALLERADALGFDAVATGHHARIVERADGSLALARGADRAKDQSYVLYMLGQRELARTLLPVGDLTKADVRARAAALGLRTATKPESMDVCFVRREDRRAFVRARATHACRRRRRRRRARRGTPRRDRGLHDRAATRARRRRRRAAVRRRRRRGDGAGHDRRPRRAAHRPRRAPRRDVGECTPIGRPARAGADPCAR